MLDHTTKSLKSHVILADSKNNLRLRTRNKDSTVIGRTNVLRCLQRLRPPKDSPETWQGEGDGREMYNHEGFQDRQGWRIPSGQCNKVVEGLTKGSR